ncbi:MAG: hypothetical protein LQ341_002363 [Variospora aurantia]|nr:MAG: hypothetical protein LQ341_002363 [Variospora aurantia]
MSRSPQASIASSAAKRSNPKHQRKHSSSKASRSSKYQTTPIAAASEDATAAAAPAPVTVTKPSAIKARPVAYTNVPSVPSTQHLHPMNIHVASFFSRHRPISVTTSFPPVFSETAFSSIFEPKASRKTQSRDVVDAVSSAINTIENAAFHDQASEPSYHPSKPTSRSRTRRTNHLDNTNNNDIQIQVKSLDTSDPSNSFRHFVPPPPPVPLTDVATNPTSSSKRRSGSKPIKERTFSLTLTITERTLPSGLSTYQASVSPVVGSSASRPSRYRTSVSQRLSPSNAPVVDLATPSSSFPMSTPRLYPPQPFLDRMKKRQQSWEDGLTGKKRQIWQSISVKRQRKLKMKKHKYKKMMRKTRNLRRRLDRN